MTVKRLLELLAEYPEDARVELMEVAYSGDELRSVKSLILNAVTDSLPAEDGPKKVRDGVFLVHLSVAPSYRDKVNRAWDLAD